MESTRESESSKELTLWTDRPREGPRNSIACDTAVACGAGTYFSAQPY